MGLKHHVNNRVSAHSQFQFVSEFKNLSIVYVLTNHTNHTNLSSEKKRMFRVHLLLNKKTVTSSFSPMLFKISIWLFLSQSLFPNTVHSLVSLCELKALVEQQKDLSPSVGAERRLITDPDRKLNYSRTNLMRLAGLAKLSPIESLQPHRILPTREAEPLTTVTETTAETVNKIFISI